MESISEVEGGRSTGGSRWQQLAGYDSSSPHSVVHRLAPAQSNSSPRHMGRTSSRMLPMGASFEVVERARSSAATQRQERSKQQAAEAMMPATQVANQA